MKRNRFIVNKNYQLICEHVVRKALERRASTYENYSKLLQVAVFAGIKMQFISFNLKELNDISINLRDRDSDFIMF